MTAILRNLNLDITELVSTDEPYSANTRGRNILPEHDQVAKISTQDSSKLKINVTRHYKELTTTANEE